MFDEILRKNLKDYRIKKGYTQEKVAKILGIFRSTYTYYETGKTQPSVETLVKLAKFYKISVLKFLK